MGRAGKEARPVPLLPVQELAGRQQGAGDDVPARYVARANDAEAAAAAAPVPVIDLGRLCQQPRGESAADEAARLRMALESWGLFLVHAHIHAPCLRVE
jgi:hypothetical protein